MSKNCWSRAAGALLLAGAALWAQVTVTVKPGGPVRIRTKKAEFELTEAGYLRAWLLERGSRLSLDDPGPGQASDQVQVNGAGSLSFQIDYARVRVQRTTEGGRRIEIPARAAGLERTHLIEVDPAFPNMLLSRVTYRNQGQTPVKLNAVSTQEHRLNAALCEPGAKPYQLWSFHGASTKWGLDEVVELGPAFSRQNPMGASLREGYGGGVPVVAFWTRRAGLAIGHLEPEPLTLSIPVAVSEDGYPRARIELPAGVSLRSGESYSTPLTFVAVYAGDFYEPLRAYSLALQKRGWKIPQPSPEAYQISWCSWGYMFNVTPAQMLGIIPKLKEFGIRWATLDDRWFDTYGDLNPRADTFPGDSIKRMVEEYHRQGIYVQLWWLPLGAEIPGFKYSSHAYVESRVVKEHPDWLVLDQEGKPALMIRRLATLCPAVPEVREYHRRLTEKFIREWGFDGHKLDNIYSVPPCYNPKHNHKSPYDSVLAMGEVYRVIFETTRALKPYSVTQSCPCGTPPGIAWLPYMDQAVTADPTSSQQVRRRVKMYKALLGPRAAVYGDHVELTESIRRGGQRIPAEPDFASSVGTGAVVGTKFVWPQTDAMFRRSALTAEKEVLWKKWISIYNEKMLSQGEFLNLYTLGYDVPEGYAIRKDGRMYYAFFTAWPDETFKGEIELRGLPAGRHRIYDYVNQRELGLVDARQPRLAVEFKGSLLVETRR